MLPDLGRVSQQPWLRCGEAYIQEKPQRGENVSLVLSPCVGLCIAGVNANLLLGTRENEEVREVEGVSWECLPNS